MARNCLLPLNLLFKKIEFVNLSLFESLDEALLLSLAKSPSILNDLPEEVFQFLVFELLNFGETTIVVIESILYSNSKLRLCPLYTLLDSPFDSEYKFPVGKKVVDLLELVFSVSELVKK